MIYYPELMDQKKIVLMKGEYDSNVIVSKFIRLTSRLFSAIGPWHEKIHGTYDPFQKVYVIF